MATKKEQIAPMYQAVCDEVKGSPVFLMRLCTGARHIEIQLMADKKGNVAVLSGRDCSMQRRFQKIVEEGPPRAVAPETLDQMERAAASLCRMVNYTHAGTVEYLFIQETQEFYFLELNPRLQAGTRCSGTLQSETTLQRERERESAATHCRGTLRDAQQRRAAETRCAAGAPSRVQSRRQIQPATLDGASRLISADLDRSRRRSSTP